MSKGESMSDKSLKQRDQIEKKYKWDIEAMYPDESKWQNDLDDSVKAAEDFAKFSGHLTESADTLYEALTTRDAIWQKLEHAYVYATMRKDEDNRVSKYQSMDDKCGMIKQKSPPSCRSSRQSFSPHLRRKFSAT